MKAKLRTMLCFGFADLMLVTSDRQGFLRVRKLRAAGNSSTSTMPILTGRLFSLQVFVTEKGYPYNTGSLVKSRFFAVLLLTILTITPIMSIEI